MQVPGRFFLCPLDGSMFLRCHWSSGIKVMQFAETVVWLWWISTTVYTHILYCLSVYPILKLWKFHIIILPLRQSVVQVKGNNCYICNYHKLMCLVTEAVTWYKLNVLNVGWFNRSSNALLNSISKCVWSRLPFFFVVAFITLFLPWLHLFGQHLTETASWTKIEPKGKGPCPRRRQCCCMVGDRIMLFGGTRWGMIWLFFFP